LVVRFTKNSRATQIWAALTVSTSFNLYETVTYLICIITPKLANTSEIGTGKYDIVG